jgi:hypothetical protein
MTSPASSPALSLPACACGSGLRVRCRSRHGRAACATCWSEQRTPPPAPLDGTSAEALISSASQRLAAALCTGQGNAWHLVYALVFNGEELPPEWDEVAAEGFAQRLLAHAYHTATAPDPGAALIRACKGAGLLEVP